MTFKATTLSFDFGASSGRAILCRFDGETMKLEEVHRFANEPVFRDGTLYWNFDALLGNMLTGIQKAKEAGGFDSIGVDTWGVDFGLLDNNGKLLELPVHYRDRRTDGLSDEVSSLLGDRWLYEQTGTQRMDINTLFQLYSMRRSRPEFLKKAKCLLMIPDLLNYCLTGERHAERTIASTTQMLDPHSREWSLPLLKKLMLPEELLPQLLSPGKKAGMLKADLCKKFRLDPVPVIAVASHDTASAVLAVPAKERDFAFFSCGTWSLLGMELDAPIITPVSQASNLTNELGFNNTVTFLKNIIGLWLIQETRRQFARDGKNYSYADMERFARESKPFTCLIDPDAHEFLPSGDIPRRVQGFCKKTGQYIPRSDGEIIRCIYESLAFKYRFAFEQIKACSKRTPNVIHLVGGGTKDSFLCQMTADSTNTRLMAGPIEATSLGNAAAQLMALGYIENVNQARAIISDSFPLTTYDPAEPSRWTAEYQKFIRLIRQ